MIIYYYPNVKLDHVGSWVWNSNNNTISIYLKVKDYGDLLSM